MSWKWYGVKTLYRTRTIGRPRKVDANYDREGTLVEERVVLFRARNFDEAMDKAEAEAKRYASAFTPRNRYGQRIRQQYLGCADAFVIDGAPAVGCEVFSSTRVVPDSVSDASLAASFTDGEPRPNPKRVKFFDAERPELSVDDSPSTTIDSCPPSPPRRLRLESTPVPH